MNLNTRFTRYSRRLAVAFGSSTPWVFLVGALAVGLLTEGVSSGIEAYFGGDSFAVSLTNLGLGTAVLLLLILFFNLPQLVRSWLSAWRRTSTISVGTNVARRRGLVALVSHGQQVPAEAAIAYHKRPSASASSLPEPGLQLCWLITGPGEGEQSSLQNAYYLRDKYSQDGIDFFILQVNDADDPKETFHLVQAVFNQCELQHGIPPQQMIADFTGGTKGMTAGMVLACTLPDWDLQHMKPKKYNDAGYAIPSSGSVPRLIRVDYLPTADN